MTLNYDQKIHFIQSLNWDYLTPPEAMLDVLEGRSEKEGPFDRKTLLARSLVRIPWHYVVALWGVEQIKELYTPDLARRLFPRSLRRHYDFALAVLRKEPLSPAGWDSEYSKQLRHTFLSDRWNRP
jgi:hypothetical protein